MGVKEKEVLKRKCEEQKGKWVDEGVGVCIIDADKDSAVKLQIMKKVCDEAGGNFKIGKEQNKMASACKIEDEEE